MESGVSEDLPQTIPGVLAHAAERFGDREALVDERARMSYAELSEAATRAARSLIASGIEPGDRVSIWAPNTTEWVIAVLGIYRAGAVLVPLNTRFKATEAAYILERADVRILFTVTDFLATNYVELLHTVERPPSLREIVVLRGAPAAGTVTWEEFRRTGGRRRPTPTSRPACDALDGDDLSDVLFTSGTTGQAQGRDAHALGGHPRVRSVVRCRRPARRRPLPDRQPVLPRVRRQGGHPRQHHHRRHDGPARGVRRGHGDATRCRGAHLDAPRSADRLPVDPRPPTRRRVRHVVAAACRSPARRRYRSR